MANTPRDQPQPHSKLQSHICIQINAKPLIHSSFHKCLLFEVFITAYYCIFTLVGLGKENERVIVYCLLFHANQIIKMIYSLMDCMDPLGIRPIKKLLELLGWAIKANMVYLLCALAYLEEHLPVLIMIIHFVVSNYKKNRPDPHINHQKGRLFQKIMDFINPILLYSFLKQFDTKQSDLSILFLIFLCCNLIGASEMRLILANQQSDMVGWSVRRKLNSKLQIFWNKAYALKLIIMGASTVLVLQNFLLMFDSIKNQICFNIVHTMIVGVAAYWVFRNHNKYNTA